MPTPGGQDEAIGSISDAFGGPKKKKNGTPILDALGNVIGYVGDALQSAIDDAGPTAAQAATHFAEMAKGHQYDSGAAAPPSPNNTGDPTLRAQAEVYAREDRAALARARNTPVPPSSDAPKERVTTTIPIPTGETAAAGTSRGVNNIAATGENTPDSGSGLGAKGIGSGGENVQSAPAQRQITISSGGGRPLSVSIQDGQSVLSDKDGNPLSGESMVANTPVPVSTANRFLNDPGNKDDNGVYNNPRWINEETTYNESVDNINHVLTDLGYPTGRDGLARFQAENKIPVGDRTNYGMWTPGTQAAMAEQVEVMAKVREDLMP